MSHLSKIVVIGANGQLASDIIAIFSQQANVTVIPLTRSIVDVTEYAQLKKVLGHHRPDAVINTAAFHQLEQVEENPDLAYTVNTTTQGFLAELGEQYNWVTVFISTDYVFGKEVNRTVAYTETDSIGPINVYGQTKSAGEQLLRDHTNRHFIIRVSGLYGKAGSAGKGGNFVELMIKLGRERKEVQVVSDQVLTPTYTRNIAQNLWSLLQTEHYGTYHMTSEGQCSWWEFAQEIFTQLSMKVRCNPVSSDFFPTKVARPRYSVLANKMLKKYHINQMNDWQTNLNLYLKEKGYIA